MSQEITNNQATEQTKQDKYFVNTNELSKEFKDLVKGRIGNDAKIFAPKENASYKGKIVHADEQYIVQTVGKDNKTAIVHPREKLELVGDSLNSRAAANDLNDRNIQVHYKELENGAKAFPWNPEKEQAKIAEAKAAKEVRELKAMTVQEVKDAAQTYAQGNIKNVKQREAFLSHLEKATESLTVQKQQQQKQPEKQPQKDMER